MAIINAVEDLIKSVYELFASVFGGAARIMQAFIHAILSFLTGFVSMVGDVSKGAIEVAGGVSQFVLGNIVVLGIIAAGGYLYMVQSQQGQRKPASVRSKNLKTA